MFGKDAAKIIVTEFSANDYLKLYALKAIAIGGVTCYGVCKITSFIEELVKKA